MGMTLDEVLARFREEAQGNLAAMGSRFEGLIHNLLLSHPLYKEEVARVWRWADFPARGQLTPTGTDAGIDLVAQTHFGDYWAIQCKCYDPGTTVSKPDVDSFLALSSKTFTWDTRPVRFTQRLIFASTDRWNATAEETLRNQTPPVTKVAYAQLAALEVDWEALLKGREDFCVKHDARPHQLKAMAAAHTHFAAHDRGLLVMACGTGKTLTALRLMEQELPQGGLVLFLVPSIALLNQTLVSWSEEARLPLTPVCVCSDATASKKKGRDADTAPESLVDLAAPACTAPRVVAVHVQTARRNKPNALTVVFSTYQSIGVVEQVQRELGRDAFPFDFIVCDEAHRTTGITGLTNPDGTPAKDSAFTLVHDNAHVLAHKRLYMTATPRLYGEGAKKKAQENSVELCSMDDEALYGAEFHRLGFGEAVDEGLLTDYKVLVLSIPEASFDPAMVQEILGEGTALEPQDAIKMIGCVNALSKQLTNPDLIPPNDRAPAKRAVAFCQRISSSQETAETFTKTGEVLQRVLPEARRAGLIVPKVQHVDGTMGASLRNERLAWLKAPTEGTECRILSNVRCLSEGVDVPSLDAVLFLSDRNSEIDVVQSVGRVMRRAPGKLFGYIIVPVVIPEGIEPEEAMRDNKRYAVVWSVLNALRAHDDRFQARIERLRFTKAQPKTPSGTDTATISGTETMGGDDAGILIDYGLGQMVTENGQDMIPGLFPLPPNWDVESLQQVVYAQIVKKVGERDYFDQLAAQVAQIVRRHVEVMRERVASDPTAKAHFERYHELLKTAIYAAVSPDDALIMLAQHGVSTQLFDILFGSDDFSRHNPISKAMDSALGLLQDLTTKEEQETLDKLYDNISRKVKAISGERDGGRCRQALIKSLYDTFFAAAFPDTAAKLGIVFTPLEVVDFILRSADDALRKHFGKKLTNEGVNILDPFTGTGTFITRLLQSGLIAPKDLRRKYREELFANEIVLLSYYIAALNIETVYHALVGRSTYQEFPGIVLGDTFRMRQVTEQDTFDDDAFSANSQRLLRENRTPISVIVGNPPYSVAKGEDYPELDTDIEASYVLGSSATNKNSLYDSYIKAFRWASNVIENPRGGVLGFVSNGGWLDSNACDAFRKALVREFDEIYCYNLRGNCNTSGEVRKRECEGIFGEGCRTPITILLLVRLPAGKHTGNATIRYRDIGDYKNRKTKLAELAAQQSFFSAAWLDDATLLKPNEHGDWINQRNDAFSAYIPLEPAKKFDKHAQAFFIIQSSGLKTARDPWCYAFSAEEVQAKMQASIDLYNRSLEEGTPIEDPRVINWNRSLLGHFQRGRREPLLLPRVSVYRPFCKMFQYFSAFWNDMIYQIPKLFPTGKQGENLVICVSGIGVTKPFSCIITDITPDLELIGKSQCFPLYWYEEKDVDLFGKKTLVRHDGVSDWVLGQARSRYGTDVTKEEIFYYVYGFLHQPAYRETFAADLKKSLPRLPLVERYEDFKKTADIGRQLAALHLNYENLEPYPLEEKGDFSDTRVTKMKFGGKGGKDRSILIVNNTLTLRGIPEEAYRYQVNGRSPIEWAVDRYQVRQDTKSGIVNDPNLWTPDNPRYIPDLIKRLVTLSIDSLNLINALPPFTAE